MRRPLFLLLALVVGAGVACSPALAADEAGPTVTACAVVVRLDPPRQRLLGEAELTVTAAANGTLVLDLAPTLRVTAVTVDGAGRDAPVRDEQGQFAVPVPAGTHRVHVAYRGRLHDEVKEAEDLAWVAGDSTRGLVAPVGVFLTGASRWIPWDATWPLVRTDVTVHAPEDLIVVCQGAVPARTPYRLQGFDAAGPEVVPVAGSGGEETAWVKSAFAAVIPTDGVSLSAGAYVVASREVEGVVLSTYFYERHALYADLWLDAAADTVRRYHAILGPYPHPKFDIVENFFQSGYGMPSFTLLGDRVIEYVSAKALRGDGIPPGYLDHEYVHGWYGNGLFVDYERGNWCEAITTYLSNYLAVELDGGGPECPEAIEARRATMEKFSIRVRGDADFPLRAFVTKKEDADNDIGYGKGSLFFHMVRRATAPDDDAWWARLRAFTTDHTGRVVHWEDWARAWQPRERITVPGGGERRLDGPFEALAPWLERKGLPRYRLAFAQAVPVDAAAPTGAQLVEIVVQETAQDGFFGGTLPVVVEGGEGEAAWRVTGAVDVVKGSGSARLTVPALPHTARLDPAFHVARAIPEDELPLCLNRTLRHPGRGVIVVRGDESAFAGLAQRLEKSTGWTVTSADFDLAHHEGPAVVLWLAADGEMPTPLHGQVVDTPSSSLLATVAWNGWPRTWYVAATPAAAARAGYVPFYGWDTWVRFDGGIPQDRAVVRPPSRSTTIDLRDAGQAALARVDEVVRHLAAHERAPGTKGHVAIEGWIRERVPLDPIDPPGADRGVGDFDLLWSWTADTVTLRYTGGHRQGSISSEDLRPAVFSADRSDGAWHGVGVGAGQVAILPWDEGDAAALYQDARRRARFQPAGLIYVVEDATYDALAPWIDRSDNLTGAGEAERNQLGRDGRKAHTGPLALWLAGRRSRLGLPHPTPLPMPVLIARRSAMPASPDQAAEPFAWIEEVALDLAIRRSILTGRNLVFRRPGSLRATSGKPAVVVLLAHYDALPGQQADGTPTYPGADDNATGVACLVEVARALDARGHDGPPLAADVVLVFPDAEEWGLLGSHALVERLLERYDVRAAISVDSIGRALSKPTHVIGQTMHPDLGLALAEALKAEGIEIGRDIDRFAYAHGSDHWPFHEAGVPALSLWASDYAVMNRPTDGVDGVEPGGPVRIARALLRWLETLR